MLESITNPVLWNTGLTTMLVGMGIVFSFLIVMVFAINIMTKVVERLNILFPLPVEEVKTAKKTKSDDSEIALAIAVALRG